MLKKILLSCFAIFGFYLLFSNNCSAAQLCSNHYDANNIPVQNDSLCITNDNYSSVKFVEIDTGGITTGINMAIRVNSNNYSISYNNIADKNYYLQGFSSISSVFYWFSFTNFGNAPSGWYVNVNFYDSLPAAGIIPTGTLNISSNGIYDVTNYASAVVDVTTTNTWVVELFKDGFWGIMTALVALIVPVLVLFLIFRLVHDWLWGKG